MLRATTPKLTNPLPRDGEDQQLLNRVIDFYHETLKQSPEALGYLEKRGIACPQVIEHFKLGVANRTLGYRLPAKNRTEGAALRGQLQRLGILRSSGHEHFNGSLVIPVMDAGGNVVEVCGRKLNENLRRGTPKHLYLPGPHAGVWNLQALAASSELILTESLIDALTFWCAGYRNVTASYGTEGFTAEPLPAQAIPPAPALDIVAEVTDAEVLIAFGERRYRIRGLERNNSFAALKVNLLVSAPGLDEVPVVHVDSLDLYSAKARGGYIKQAAAELGLQEEVIKRDLGQVLLKCEALQEQRLNGGKESQEKADAMSDAEHQAALDLLTAPALMERIVQDFERCGLVGESANLLTAYLAAVSRKLDQPLAILIQSTSAAGKSALMEAVLDLIPEEERVQYSAMTGQSLYYLGETELKHKILAIAEEEGMSEAAYALKLLQSQGELTIASLSAPIRNCSQPGGLKLSEIVFFLFVSTFSVINPFFLFFVFFHRLSR